MQDDRFGVVDFSRYVRTFDVDLRPASDASAGIDYVRDLGAGGNTNIAGALERGMEFLDGDRPGTVIFVTDGLATVGVESAEGILDIAEACSPGAHPALRLRRGLRRRHHAARRAGLDLHRQQPLRHRPRSASTPRSRASGRRVSTPVLSDIEIVIDGVETWDLAPAEIPGIFAGNQALLTGRYDGSGEATVTVSGNSAQGPE